MRPNTKIVIASFTLLLASLACVTLMGEDLPETQSPILPVPEQILTEVSVTQEAVSCPIITDQIIALAVSGGEEMKEDLLDTEVTLVTYTISGDELINPFYTTVSSNLQTEQDDTQTHQKIWDYFRAIIPSDQRSVISEYAIITDGQGGTLASVSQTYSDPDLWSLQVDIADTANYYDLTYTLVHEFGHLLTLGPNQVPPSLAVFNNPEDDNIYLDEVSACPNYFPGEGCAKVDSYINSYYNQFWVDIYDEWNEINLEEDEDAYYDKLDAFYFKYSDQFATSYAATNPEEDIAEAWAFFVFSPKPTGGTIAEEKILFFYQYPELVELRANILANMCVSFPK
ncbi:MAG: hypothetical protein U0V02_03635 [Anaerolineales bacterium]